MGNTETMLECSACGRTEDLRHSPFHGEHIICRPCFMIWYDYGVTDPNELGKLSHKLEREGKFPFRKSV